MTQKTITLDWDNKAEVLKLHNMVKCRLVNFEDRPISKSQANIALFEACKRIYETDISHVYKDMELDEQKRYYVYAHMNPLRKIAIGAHGRTSFAASIGLTHFPIYIGKGTGDRCDKLDRSETHKKIRQGLRSVGKDLMVFKIIENVSELDALCCESKLIDIFGILAYHGVLANFDEGYKSTERRNLYLADFESMSLRNKHWNKEIAVVA